MLINVSPISTLFTGGSGSTALLARCLALSALVILLAPARPAFPSLQQHPSPATLSSPTAAVGQPAPATDAFVLQLGEPAEGANGSYRGEFKAEYPKQPASGVGVPSFVLQKGEYGGSGYTIFAEMGNLRINQTRNTLQEAAGKGGRFACLIGTSEHKARFESFAVTGAHGKGPDDLLVGATGELSLLRDTARFKTIFLSGRESLDKEGRWPDAGARTGDVLGLLAVLDPFQGRLAAEAELSYAAFDADSADDAQALTDSACRIKVGGGWGNSRYSALYERTGPQYRLMLPQGPARDTEGVSLGVASALGTHGFDFKLSRYNDNTESNALYPRLYRYEGLAEYRFKGITSLPLALQYRKTFTDSSNEPVGYLATEVAEDAVAGQVNYLVGKWDVGLRGGVSRRVNKLSAQRASSAVNLGLLPKFATGVVTVAPELTLKRSTDYPTSVRTDQYAVHLGLNGSLLKRLDYELKGGFNKETSAVPGYGREMIGAKVKAAYPLARFFKWKGNSSLAIRGEYKDINNRSLDSRQSDYSLLLSLDGGAFL